MDPGIRFSSRFFLPTTEKNTPSFLKPCQYWAGMHCREAVSLWSFADQLQLMTRDKHNMPISPPIMPCSSAQPVFYYSFPVTTYLLCSNYSLNFSNSCLILLLGGIGYIVVARQCWLYCCCKAVLVILLLQGSVGYIVVVVGQHWLYCCCCRAMLVILLLLQGNVGCCCRAVLVILLLLQGSVGYNYCCCCCRAVLVILLL